MSILINTQRELIELAREQKLDGFAGELYDQFSNPQLYNGLSFEERFKRCFDRQAKIVAENKFNSLFRASKIRNKLYINQFTANPSRGIEANDLLLLSDCSYIDAHINIFILGLTGTGKTALASAAGIEAMKKGYSVMFFRMSDLALILETKKDSVSFTRFRDKLRKIKLLIIDDYGLINLSDSTIASLNEIAEARYDIGSTIITSQLKREAMIKVIKPSPIRDAFADRIFRQCDREISLKGDTWRGSCGELHGVQND